MDWIPIEKAPKDGRWLLLYQPGGETLEFQGSGRWNGKRWVWQANYVSSAFPTHYMEWVPSPNEQKL